MVFHLKTFVIALEKSVRGSVIALVTNLVFRNAIHR